MMHVAPATHAPAPGTATPRHQQLQRAAEQFETVMLGELMKPLQNDSGFGDTDDSSSNALNSYGTEALAGALAHSGALGFASRMIESMESRQAPQKSDGSS